MMARTSGEKRDIFAQYVMFLAKGTGLAKSAGKVAGRETYSGDQEFSSGHAGFEKS